ncbi:non-ribosomal peptide synthetase, partial [Corallococcus sp. AB049A]|uniref:non-ribosomal peptide synthase/polyketide synthase n=1 Tax=Corallococcus sp. AB049A TaxID=2316721 RepID=UPI000ECEF6DC
SGTAYEPPRTEAERKLAAIWEEVLRVPRVGVKDNFFSLGGHSLLATQVVSRIRAELGVELALRVLFEAPVLETLAERLKTAPRQLHTTLNPTALGGPAPLSFAQQRLWFIDQLEPGTSLYNVPVAVRLDGELDVAALEGALREVVRRHESLRTTFEVHEGQPAQRIHAEPRLALVQCDLRALGSEQREQEVRRQLGVELAEPFDLSQGPLIRASLLRLGSTEHVLLVTMHHIVSDGWSLGVLIREVGALYAAFAEGRPSPLPELSLQYAGYAAWQRGWLQGDTLQKEVDFWRKKLAGAPPVLELPTDRPRPAVRGNAGAVHSFLLPPALAQSLRELAQREGASLYMVLLAGWQALLSRYSGQDDISVGSPIAGRTRAELEGLIGFFVNTLVLRAHVDGEASFRELLKQVRGTVLEAYEHQEVPFEKLVEALQPERSRSHTPLFQSMLALQNTPDGEARLPGLTMKPVDLELRTSKFDVSVYFVETPQGLSGTVEYSTDLFEASTVHRMVEHLRVLLEGVVAKPEEAVGRLSLLMPEERQQVLVTWNQQQAEYDRDATIPALFEAQAKRSPNAVAVVSGKQRLTYREVEARANQLAHRLRKLGVGPESRVGLCVERTADVVVGTLGILKAGGAYVPLDPSYPKERLGWLLEDAQGPALVAHSHLLESLPSFSAQAVCLDTDATLAMEPKEAPETGLRPENVAYLIYTSGSTGRPKGVAVTHRNAAAFLAWARETFTEEEMKAVLAATSLNFDLSVFELFAPLVRGGSVVVVRNALHLAEEKPEAEVTLINTVPSAMAQLVRLGAVPPSVSVVNLAGEALPETLAKAVYGIPTVKKLYNLYGPSEDTTYSTWSLVGRNEVPNIGRPLTNTRAYVLDKYLQPVPVGVAGELFLAGEGQARGYLLRPELTAEKFLPEVYGPEGSRMYRTGDRVRYRADGVLEYLGRIDFQVKVRGFRIELGEVEAALRQQEAVKEAVVVAKGEGAEKRLVAYVAPKAGATLEAEALKASLRQRLPEYMVPGAVVVLEALPLNANGKVDRKALPEPEAPTARSTYVAPRTEVEAKLAAIWAEVLRIPQVGVKDDFFALGGHSLLVTQVVSRIRAETGVELPLRALFDAPTLEALAQRMGTASRVQSSLLGDSLMGTLPPLSFAQQRLWFIDQMDPGTALYNVPVAVRLVGTLDVAALERALNEVVRRHDSLRTTFEERGGQAIQVIHPTLSLELGREDLRSVDEAHRQKEARRQVEQEMLRPFDLGRGPLIRTRLFTLKEREHVLVVTMHHIVSDGWSLGVLIRELGALYAAFSSGQLSPLPELPVQYTRYAAWQRDRLQGEVLERQVDYWKRKLGGAPPVLELPTDRPRSPERGIGGATYAFTLSRSLTGELKALAQREGASLYMVLLAAWQVLMARYSGQQDISVGSPIAGRMRAELEGLIGFFVNTLVLRANVDGALTFRQLLAQVRETVLDAYEHQEVPFEKLVEVLQPERSRSHTPLFQTMLALQNMPMNELRLPDLSLLPVEVENPIAKFDLSVSFMEIPNGLSGMLEYSTELFDAGTIQRLVAHLLTLIEAGVERPDTRVSRLPLLTAAERRDMLVEWNATRAPFPEACMHSLFEAQVRRAPDAVAAVFEGTQLTYAQLDARANQLAHGLRRRGVGPEVRVALGVERSLDIVIGLLGILKAGGAWVPVDPLLPRERLAFMLEDSAAQVLVTQQPLVDRFPEALHARALCLDTERESLAKEPADAPVTGVTPGNLAYLLYTSGSTGTPKGTAVEHRGVANLVTHEAVAYGIGPGSRVLQFASLSFDLSVEEIFTTLCNGATLVLAPLEKLMPGEPLPVLLREQGLSVVSLTPAALAATSSDGLPHVRTVISGGDALPADVVARWAPGRRLLNTYGPTEATVIATLGEVAADGDAPSIGKPLANVRVYVLDPYGQPVPRGVRGELHIGGVGVARGYAGRPGLTAERFIPDAFSSTPGARLYRTGDVVRWRVDGQLEFVGRLDFQVKLRGFRIELGEVEATLARQPGVSEAVVRVWGDGADKRLVGYVVAKDGHALDVDTLRTGLRQGMPEYMVPAVLMVLDALPLNANGKVDRKVLPEPEAARGGDAYVAPRTVTEAKLAAAWAEVLRLERVGVKDNFFALGGHSLLATQVVSRLRTSLGVELPLRLLFEAPTVEALAQRIEQLGRSGVPTLSAGVRPVSLPLSFAQQRLWFIDQLEPGSSLYNVPSVVRLEGDLNASALEQSLREVVQRHEALRTTFEEEAGQPVQRIHASVDVPLVTVDLSAAGAEREDVARQRVLEEMAKPFDLMRGPVLRALLVRLDARDHLLVISMHHIVSDGWSVSVLLRELGALYTARASGHALALPPLPVQYADYAAWQRDWLRDETLAREVDYWKQQLAGAPPVLELPTDRPRPAVRTNAGTTLGFMLPLELSQRLSTLARNEGASLYMVLLAGWQVLLSRYSGQDDISVGSPIAGRTRSEVEGLIGFFVNTLVLRTQVDGDPSFRALLTRVRERVLGAYEHQEVPFEKLVEALQPERSLSHSPLFQSLMSLQNVPVEESHLPGLVLKPVSFEGRTSKFDLSLFFSETPDGLSGAVEYSTDLFEASTVRRMVEHLRVLLEGVVAKPEEAVGRLPLLTPEERQQVLVTWNQRQAEYDRDATIPALFEAQAKRTPNAVAVVSGKQRLTYREVEARANQLAHRLRKLGVGPESRVGLCVERTADVVVGTLGILKAGGAYVPLDPSYPKERLGWLLEDAQGPALVAHSHLLESLPAFSAQAVCLDREEEWAEESCCPPMSEVRPENVAYLIYTSGSTGRPKGVAVTHRNAVAFLAWATETFTEEETKAVLAATSLNFDLSVFELFAPLVRGGSVVVVRNALHLAEEKPEADITLINTVPSAMAQLVRLNAVPPSVQVINLAGEALPETLAKAVYAVPTVKKLYNLYGPSEDTTYSTWSLVGRNEVPNIGRPLTNTRAYVLDKYLQPVPVGVAGELYLAGEGQARGYLLRPELTAEKFLPEVYGPEGSRMYRTGDRVRYRADGVLEYLGRIDFQVKVRGFRIELGEVESALRQQEAVKEAVVVAKGEGAEKRLIAYVAPKAGTTLEAEALKASLRQRLPEYMVPGALVVLEALPLNSNGKVDRKALPEPEAPTAGSTYVAPRTEVEAKLATIWAEVLRVPQVGVKDDFFALGGHSLLATQVVSRVRAETGAELPLRALFEAPTVETLSRKLEKAGRAKAPALVPVSRDAPLPLSFAQQRLWFIDLLEPGSSLYNVPIAVRLEGDLNVAVLEQSLRELVRRHEALRTTFEEEEGQPVQRIHESVDMPLDTVDLSAFGAERENVARQQVLEEMAKPFDLRREPLLRARLLKLDTREHVLVITMHHIVSDGWSLGVLIREVGTLYAAFVQGQPSPLPELPVQYADYAAWQRGWLQGATLQQEVDYWKQKLAGAPPVLELPTDRPRPVVRTNAGTTLGFMLPLELSQRLSTLARNEGASLYMVLLAGWQVLLSRYSGQQDISVGSPIAGRTRSEVEGLIGFFVNTLVLRTDLSGDPGFRSLLQQVRETVLEAQEHQEVPFEKLVEALQPERSRSHTPLFQTLLALQNVPVGEARLPGMTLKPVEFAGGTSKFDLSLFFSETPDGLSGTVEYSTDLFEASTVRRMVEHLRVLLEGVVAKPEEAVGRLPLLMPEERQQVLVTWNQRQAEYDRDATIPALFEAQAKRTPNAVAVVSGKQRLTYREVEARANQLAHRLRKLGVGPESRVGLCVERTADVVVGTLGILKAGGAYVPLDPSYPKERLGWLLEDAQGPALVAHSHLLESLPAFSAQAVCLDREEEWVEESCCPLTSEVRPENVAYLIYTSGSTGRPKGVAVTHRNAAAFLAWATETFTEEETKAVLAATSLNFDLSVFELFAPLVRGGSVVVVRNALHLAEEKPDADITLINTVPSAMAQLVRLGAVPPSVQVINLAGEALPETLAKAVYGIPTVRKLYNLYGPSEDTTYSTWSLVGRNEVPNIGRPLTNTRTYVLDKYLQPVPVGVAGELFLAGEGQARGYLLRPELTAEKFLPEVYGPEGSRMYRTGDRVRYRADGVLEYLGRVDFQVKVRGFRIELGEVESALRQQEAVKDAVVVAKGEGAEKRLVAYVAPKAGATLEAEALKASLRQRLPEYMVPGALVVLEALPLNSNGKVDRKALPEPEAPTAGSTYVAPRTETEAKLASIWAEVLRVPQVGVKDDFFALGGHSLLATQVVSRVRAETGAELPLRALFEAPTVETLSRKLEKAGRAKAPALVPVSRDAPLPLSFAQQRLWFIDQLEPGTALYNVPIAVRLEGDLDVAVLEQALREVVHRHEALRTTFVAGNPEPEQRPSPDSVFTVAVEDLTSNTAALQKRVEQEVLRPFELAHGPLLRARLLKLDAREHVLVVTMHHIVSDGWSLGVLIREVGALYAAFVQGQPSPLPELPVQYADYAAWQRGWLQGATLQREVDYWKQKLAGAPPVLELPTDRPRPAVRGNAGANHGFLWPQSLVQGLKSLAQREGASLYMVLLAGWQVLLSRYSGQQDISVGSPIAGRTRSEVEGLIGFFVNTLVLRTDLSGDPGFRSLLQQVRETVLEAQEHQEVPFEKLVEALQPERSRSHTPLFQTLLALQNVPVGEARLPGMTLKPVEFAGGTSKFDLSVFFVETAEGVSGTLEYSTDLFDAATVHRMVEHLRVLLEGVVAKPEESVGRLPLLTPEERQQVLVTWNQLQAEYDRDATIPRFFDAQAKRTPDAIAVVSGKQRLTYREVEARANQLAHRLRKLGVGPESRVGLCVERTADVVVGTLGILKAGGAYVPLDPSYPKERLGWLLEDAQGPALVAHSHLLESLPAFSAQAVCLDTDATLAMEPKETPETGLRPENVAYLIYTSGSTGRPKGVAVTHRNAAAFLAWATETFTEEETKAVLAATSLNFDLSVFELFAPLVRGGSVVVVRNALHLVEEKPEADITLINTVPSAMAQLVRLNAVPPSVRVVNLAGEALPETLAKAVYGIPTVRKLYNLYGPSEDTTYSTWSLVGRNEVPNIGRPLTNTRAYVLDKYLQPVPVGVAGELFLAGEGQARGYLLRPELTAEKFLPEVYGPEGSRMYRTGDRVRFRADGVLEYLGRIDFQVKVRGFRIELGEVEAALRQQEAVKEAVVVAKGEGAEKRLVAYVAPKAGATLEAEALKASLRQRLPEYMVPGALVVLGALPLTANGKVDRKALPDPDVTASQSEHFVAPRDALESQLVAVWEEVLGVKPIGVRTSFFALGGHSLLAVRLMAALREQLGREVPLAALFQHPTVEELAKLLRAETETWSPLVPLEKGDAGRRPLFLVHPGGGNVLAYPELARLLGPHQPVFGIQARGLQAGHAVVETVEEMATLYADAIRAEQPEGPYLLAGWSLGGVIAFEMARQLRAQGQAVGLLALVDAYVPGIGAPSGDAPTKAPDASTRVAFAQTVAQAFALSLPVSDEALERMDDESMLGTLLAVGVQAGLLEEATGREQLRALFRVYQANLRAMDRYVPSPYDGPALLLAAEANPTSGVPRHRGWEPFVRGGLDVRDVPGGHHQLMQDPYVRHVATLLRQALEDKS